MNHLNEMRSLARKLSLVFAMMCALVVQSCKDDDEDPEAVTVEFSTGDISVQETAEQQTITLSLDKAAFRDGTLSISVAPQNAADVLIVPATVPVTKGNTAVLFTVTPVNNNSVNSIPQVTLTLSSIGDGFVLGTKKEIKVTVLDDEGPVQASFEAATGTVTEGDDAVTVSILLSRAVKTAGNIVVAYAPADAKITTTPAATAGKFTLSVAVGADEVSFAVLPQAGATANGDLDITFSISEVSGGDIAAVAGTKHVLTVEAQPEVEYTSIHDLRAMFTGAALKLENPIKIRGTVISSNDNVTSKNIWVHDGADGILLRFIENNYDATSGVSTLKKGDEVAVELTGGTLQEFNGTLQVGNNDLAIAKATTLGTHALPTPKVISVEDLRTGNFEGQLVKIENVSFTEANGTATLNNSTNKGNATFTNGTNTGVLRVESYATFKGNAIPQGTGAIMGIASEFTSGGNTTYQVTPQTTADIFESNATATIEASETSLAFGDVDKGAESAAQNFTVKGTSLTADLTITAPDQFLVSLTEGSDYAKTVSITAANANANTTTVYAKFAPTSGTNQTFNGKLVLTSTGAGNVAITVSGSETGNSAPPTLTIQFNEFHYDNTGTDVNEFIEVMSTDVNLDITNYQIILYNGNNGASYGSIALSATTKTTVNGRDYYVWNIGASPGFQNGSPDGMALVNGTTVIQFLSYEGTFKATNGAALDVTSVDVGVIEDGTAAVPDGSSIQRKADGTWELTAGTGANTKGAPNVHE